jgi:hypothetical protein
MNHEHKKINISFEIGSSSFNVHRLFKISAESARPLPEW